MRGFPPASITVLTAVFGLLGCVGGPGDGEGLPAASFETYEAQVEPILGARCGLASCHGAEDRPLALYVEPHHRQPGSSGPLTAEERRANYDRARSFLVFDGDPAEAPLLTEPLAVSAGGVRHGPGPVFEDTIDHEYQILLAWAEEALEAPP